MSEKLIISSELAERLALSTSTVLDWFEGRPAPGFKLGRALRVRESGASLDNRVDDVEAPAIPIVGSLTGLRPSELLGLERRDVDRNVDVLHVRRGFAGGDLRPYGTTAGAL